MRQEEDFTSQLFHRELLRRFEPGSILEITDTALSWLRIDGPHKTALAAIQNRVLFQQQFLKTLTANVSSREIDQSAVQLTLGMLREVEKTTKLGAPINDCFSLKLQRKLASSVPPKPMIRISEEQTFSYLNQLFIDSANALRVLDMTNDNDFLGSYWIFMSQSPQPSVFLRSLLQSYLVQDERMFGQYSPSNFVILDMQRLVLPGSRLLQDLVSRDATSSGKPSEVLKPIDEFLSKCRPSYLNIFRTYCLNRCRVRRTLCHAIVEWDHLQADAEDTDSTLQTLTGERAQGFPSATDLTYSFPLSSWVYHHKLCQMELIVHLGFELSIYAADELPGMYWYLSHLCTVHLAHLDRISFFVEKSDPGFTVNGISSFVNPEEHAAKKAECHDLLFRSFRRLKGVEAFARALHRLYALLFRYRLIPKPPRPYSTDEMRYELRMRPFGHLSIPEPVDFIVFQRWSFLNDLTDQDILEEATEAIAVAKKAWEDVLRAKRNRFSTTIASAKGRGTPLESSPKASILDEEWVTDVKNTLKACIGTSIVIGTIKKKLAGKRVEAQAKIMRNLRVELPRPPDRDSWHSWWLCPRVSDQDPR